MRPATLWLLAAMVGCRRTSPEMDVASIRAPVMEVSWVRANKDGIRGELHYAANLRFNVSLVRREFAGLDQKAKKWYVVRAESRLKTAFDDQRFDELLRQAEQQPIVDIFLLVYELQRGIAVSIPLENCRVEKVSEGWISFHVFPQIRLGADSQYFVVAGAKLSDGLTLALSLMPQIPIQGTLLLNSPEAGSRRQKRETDIEIWGADPPTFEDLRRNGCMALGENWGYSPRYFLSSCLKIEVE